jgi:acyl carrier protein
MADRTSDARLASLEERVIGLLGKVLYVDGRDLDPDQSFTDAGLDSILAVEFISAVRDEFALSLMVAAVYDHDTPRKFAQFLATCENAGSGTALAGHDAGDRDAGEVARKAGA